MPIHHSAANMPNRMTYLNWSVSIWDTISLIYMAFMVTKLFTCGMQRPNVLQNACNLINCTPCAEDNDIFITLEIGKGCNFWFRIMKLIPGGPNIVPQLKTLSWNVQQGVTVLKLSTLSVLCSKLLSHTRLVLLDCTPGFAGRAIQ